MLKIVLVSLIVLSACNSGYDFRNVSDFRMDPSALRNEEKIKLIYSSRGPDYNKEQNYFIHLIAVSQETGDTVNILTPFMNVVGEKTGDIEFTYFNDSSEFTQVAFMSMDGTLKGESGKTKEIPESSELLERMNAIKKVARDPAFDQIAINNYPTVKGVIGTSEDGGEKGLNKSP